jgi:hypothetical protein
MVSLQGLKLAWINIWVFIPRIAGLVIGSVYFHLILWLKAFIQAFKDSKP